MITFEVRNLDLDKIHENQIENEKLKKENEELQSQIEKMKCCENCSNKDCIEKYQYTKKCKYPNKWELAE